MTTLTQDADLIRHLGGPSKVAELIGLAKRGGAQRVQNWQTRGIPPAIKVKHPHLFMPHLSLAAPTHQPTTATNVAQDA